MLRVKVTVFLTTQYKIALIPYKAYCENILAFALLLLQALAVMLAVVDTPQVEGATVTLHVHTLETVVMTTRTFVSSFHIV